MSERQPSPRAARLVGLTQLAVRRFVTKAVYTDSRRVRVSILGVAFAIALTLIVAGVALGLAAQTTVGGEDVDYWIVPEEGTASTMVVSTGGPQFGRVHSTATQLTAHPDIDYATPVLVELLQLTSDGQSEFVLAIGVVPQPGLEVAGLATDRLTPGDPYYANGSYNGTWTGEAILSTAAAELLGVSTGASLSVTQPPAAAPSFSVRGTETGTTTGLGQVPIAVVHLAEFQAVVGATTGDQADQLLVATNTPAVEPQLATVYPNSVVIARSSLTAQAPSSGLPLAISLTAALVGLIVGTLFVATTMGLEITADRRTYGMLGAIGFGWRSQAVLVFVQTLLVTVTGGLIGVGLGVVGIHLTNHLAMTYLTATPIAQVHPLLVGYGLALALLTGLVAVPYLLWLTTRTTPIEELTR